MSSGRGVAARPATSLKGPCRFSASESCDHRQRAAAHRPSRGWTRVGGPEDGSRLPDGGGPDRRRHAHHLPSRAPWRCQDEEAERGERAAHRPRPASGEWSPLRPDGGGGRLYDRPGHRSGPAGEYADGALQRREPFGRGLQSQDGPPEAGFEIVTDGGAKTRGLAAFASTLYDVDLATGAATSLGTIGGPSGSIVGLSMIAESP